jgi:very-short-patch-repair endonuclease
MKNYDLLSKSQKLDLLNDLYINNNKSFADIAELYNTYPNKVRRDAKALKIPIRNKSDAQKNALTTGKHKHPTKGQTRSQDTKDKIGYGVLESWKELSKDELKERKEKAKENWEKLSKDQKVYMQRSATDAVRLASKIGSKLEKFLFKQLITDGYGVDFHKEQTLVNTKLQIDLFLPKLDIAIEVDGPSHFEPVWGKDSLDKNIKYDNKKEGLIVGKGWHLIRIKQTKDFSPARAKICYSRLKEQIDRIVSKNNKTVESLTIED